MRIILSLYGNVPKKTSYWNQGAGRNNGGCDQMRLWKAREMKPRNSS